MKAVAYRHYGSPDVLELEEIDKPVPADDEVLVGIRAASVNSLDWHLMRGRPYVARAQMGLRKPKVTRLGRDLAGRVEAVGGNVTRFKPGDEVFGASRVAFAEYACADENTLALKPANLTFEQAAAVPVAATTALQGQRDRGRIRPGQKVLINGAAGGVGTFAVQIAKALGAHVTGVCGTRNQDMVRALGGDRAIDYTREDFAQSGQRYDLIFDCVGNHSLSTCRRVMSPRGTYIVVGGPDGRWLGPLPRLLKARLLSPFVSQELVTFLASTNKEDLVALKGLIEAGKVTPVIDRCYPLSKVPEAIRYLEAGHARGEVVMTVEHDKA